MRSFIALILGSVVFAGGAAADTRSVIVENTIHTKRGDGEIAEWWFDPDGSYTMTIEGGLTVLGAWDIGDGGWCIIPDGGEKSCVTLPPEDAAVGDSWLMTTSGGDAITATIVSGR